MDGSTQGLLKFATTYLSPTLIVMFCIGVVLRGLIYWTVKREDWFSKEFERRVHDFMENLDSKAHYSFFLTTKKILEKTFYELFIMRSVMKRRKHDVIMGMNDRVFLIQQGAAFIVKDTLKQIKYLRHGNHAPKMLEIARNVCQNNPCFNKVFAIIPLNINDVINVLPGIFVIGGIFGTFLGIMEGLHTLTSIDIANVEETQATMNGFLSHVAFSMKTSIVGIILSVSMTIFNTVINPEKKFMDIVERFENCLDVLWNRSDSNILPEHISNFDENRDPAEALAENAVDTEFKKSRHNSVQRPVYGQNLVKDAIENLKDGAQSDQHFQDNPTAESVIENNTEGDFSDVTAEQKEEDEKVA